MSCSGVKGGWMGWRGWMWWEHKSIDTKNKKQSKPSSSLKHASTNPCFNPCSKDHLGLAWLAHIVIKERDVGRLQPSFCRFQEWSDLLHFHPPSFNMHCCKCGNLSRYFENISRPAARLKERIIFPLESAKVRVALDILKNERVKFRVKSAAGWAHRDPPTKGYMIYRIWSLNSVTHVYPVYSFSGCCCCVWWCSWPCCWQWSFFFWRWGYKMVQLSMHICYCCWWRCWCWDWCGAGGGRAAHLRRY